MAHNVSGWCYLLQAFCLQMAPSLNYQKLPVLGEAICYGLWVLLYFFLLYMPRMQSSDHSFSDHFSRLCLLWADLRGKVMSPFGIKNRVAYCLPENSMVPKLSVFVSHLCCKPIVCTASVGPTALLQWHLRARGTDTHADAYASCCAMNKKVLCLWPRSSVASVSIHKKVTS